MKSVCYFTSKDDNDIRVIHKECASLIKAGYKVTVVSPEVTCKEKNGIEIKGVNYHYNSNLRRFITLPRLLYKKACEVNADIYHFNDPASLPYALKLKRKGKKVIFDAFEDHPSMWNNRGRGIVRIFCKAISLLYERYEKYVCSRLDGVIVCYHWTKDRLASVCDNIELVFNYPILSEEISEEALVNKSSSPFVICYPGTIDEGWNISTIIRSISKCNDVNFLLAGWPANPSYIDYLKSLDGWNKVSFIGKIPKESVKHEVFDKANIGIALFQYCPLCHGNYGNLSNNKLFEYMNAGLPVICTDFILWKEVIEGNHCGICINPNNEAQLIEAINYIASHNEEAAIMGTNGRRAVRDKYNWGTQERLLLSVYNNL